MVIPHNESHVREFHVSRLFVWGFSATIATFFCALLFYAFGYYLHLSQELTLANLDSENSVLKSELNRIQEQMGNLRLNVDALSEKDRMMRAIASLAEPGPEIRQMGVGGGLDGEMPAWESQVAIETGEILTETYTNLDQLLREAGFLQASFDTIMSTLNQNDHARRHTPSISPVKGEMWVSSLFGNRFDPFTGRREFHRGLDLAGRSASPIVATADGIVDQVAKDKYLGWYVAIKHDFGFRTVYGHLLKKPPVKKGQKVVRGERIGDMGSSGRSTATHVHYGVSKNGLAVNPKSHIFDTQHLSSIY